MHVSHSLISLIANALSHTLYLHHPPKASIAHIQSLHRPYPKPPSPISKAPRLLPLFFPSSQLIHLRRGLLKIIKRMQRQPTLRNLPPPQPSRQQASPKPQPPLPPTEKKIRNPTHHPLPVPLIRTPQPHHNRHPHAQLPIRHRNTLGDHIAAGQAAEDIDEDGEDAGVGQEEAEGGGHGGGGRFAAGVEEVGDGPAAEAEGVDGVHGEAGAVDWGGGGGGG